MAQSRAANILFSGNLRTIEFGMYEYELSRPAPFDQPDFIDTARTGGGFVAGDVAWTITNPGEGDGVRYFTDPERKIYPGDMLTFDDDGRAGCRPDLRLGQSVRRIG